MIVRALEGNRYLIRQEIGEELNRAGVVVGDDLVKYFLGRARVDGVYLVVRVVYNGIITGGMTDAGLVNMSVRM